MSFVSIWFHAKMFNSTMPDAIAAIYAYPPWQVLSVLKQSASCVFFCLKSRYLSFVFNQKSRSSSSAMYSPHSKHKSHQKNEESHTDLLHQHTAVTYLLQPTTTIPLVQRTWKEFLPSLDQGKIATKREVSKKTLPWKLTLMFKKFDLTV
jgi:hypothetical protein